MIAALTSPRSRRPTAPRRPWPEFEIVEEGAVVRTLRGATGTQVFFWDGRDLIEEVDTSGVLLRRYDWVKGPLREIARIHLPDVLDLDDDSSTADKVYVYPLNDARGSVRVLWHSSATECLNAEFYVYSYYGVATITDKDGNLISTTLVDQPWSFAGLYSDHMEASGHLYGNGTGCYRPETCETVNDPLSDNYESRDAYGDGDSPFVIDRNPTFGGEVDDDGFGPGVIEIQDGESDREQVKEGDDNFAARVPDQLESFLRRGIVKARRTAVGGFEVDFRLNLRLLGGGWPKDIDPAKYAQDIKTLLEKSWNEYPNLLKLNIDVTAGLQAKRVEDAYNVIVYNKDFVAELTFQWSYKNSLGLKGGLITGAAPHEFGHILGFAHRGVKPNAAAQTTGIPATAGASIGGATGALASGKYPPASMMSYDYNRTLLESDVTPIVAALTKLEGEGKLR